jgi:RND family efflux transporter MFP subunit
MHLRAAVVGTSLVALAACAKTPAPPSAERARIPRPTTTTVVREDVPEMLSFDGVVVATRDATLASPTGGRVDAILDRGEAVAAGAAVVRFSEAEQSMASAGAGAGLLAARARLNGATQPEAFPEVVAAEHALTVAKDACDRAERLRETGSVSEQELVRARAAVAQAEAQRDAALGQAKATLAAIDQARAVAGQADLAFRERALRAPFAGVVLDRFVNPGDAAGPFTAVARVVDPTSLRVRFDVLQHEATQVARGARVHVVGIGDGTVRVLAPGLAGAENVRTVFADLDRPETALVGARVRLHLDTGRRSPRVVLPSTAVRTAHGVTRAWVITNGRVDERLLAIDRSEPTGVLVRSGVDAGEAVVVDPAKDLRDGVEVTP